MKITIDEQSEANGIEVAIVCRKTDRQVLDIVTFDALSISDIEVRTPAENARAFLVTLCISFTIVMIVYMALESAFVGDGLRWSMAYCWSLLGACACTAELQLVFFTPVVIKRMTYPLRLFLFGICLYAVLAALAVTMAWFPADMAGA